MAKYSLAFRKSVAKDLRPIPRKDIARILRRIEALQDDPRLVGREKLSRQERYQICQGLDRIIHEITDEHLVVAVVKVGNRRHVYRRS